MSLIAQDNNVTINGMATFGTHSNRDRHIPVNNTIEGFEVKGELFINACGAAVAKNNRAAQLTVKTFGLTDAPSYSSDMSTSSVTALSEKAKEFVTHILNGGNTFGSQLENCCIFEFYGLPFDSLQ